MSSLSSPSEIPPRRVPAWVLLLAALGVGIGALAFGLGLAAAPAQAWRGLYVNFVFWTALAQGAVIWSVAFRITRTSWSAAINRMGHAYVSFLPFALLVFLFLYLGRGYLLPWLHLGTRGREWWLNAPFMWVRDGAALLVLMGLSWAYVRVYLRADRGQAVPDAATPLPEAAGESARVNHRLSVLGVVLLFAYGWLFSLLGFDLVHSLTPTWHSALFGWFFAVSGMYTGLAALIVTAAATRRWLGVADRVGRSQWRDLGNLLLAFAMVMTYFLYAQALPIWYENLPFETSFAIARVHAQPWQTLSLVLLFTCFLGVFALLVIREMKERPATLVPVALLVLASMWLERYVEIVPSQAPFHPAFPALGLLIGLGFLGVMVLGLAWFLARYPALSPLDLVLKAELEQWL